MVPVIERNERSGDQREETWTEQSTTHTRLTLFSRARSLYDEKGKGAGVSILMEKKSAASAIRYIPGQTTNPGPR